MTQIGNFGNRMEAEVAAAKLADAGIDAEVVTDTSGFGGIKRTEAPTIRLLVRTGDAARAVEIAEIDIIPSTVPAWLGSRRALWGIAAAIIGVIVLTVVVVLLG